MVGGGRKCRKKWRREKSCKAQDSRGGESVKWSVVGESACRSGGQERVAKREIAGKEKARDGRC